MEVTIIGEGAAAEFASELVFDADRASGATAASVADAESTGEFVSQAAPFIGGAAGSIANQAVGNVLGITRGVN